MNLSPVAKVFLLASIGLVSAVIGVTLYVTFPPLLKSQIEKRLILTEESQSYSFWKSIPIPVYLRFYFFTITNPYEVWNDTSKPIVEEMGPYTFRESREKVNITWNENGTVTYRQVKRWYYQPDLTNGSLDDVITTINVPMMAAAAKAKVMNNSFVYFAMGEMFDYTNSSWFLEKPVRELLFEGYKDPLLDAAKSFVDIPYDKFGWFYKRNGSDDGEFSIYTGAKDLQKLAEVETWNGSSTLTTWKGRCNMINGSAGDMWPPYLKQGGKVQMFITDICRSLSFTYLTEKEVNGLKAYRYWADKTELDNGKTNPNNKCFCSDTCLPPGGLNVSLCKFEAPAVVSYPHFLYADSSYRQGVIGLRPDPNEHKMFIDIEPNMGIPLNVAARMQINIVFEGIPEIPQFANVTKRTYYPVLWFSETATVDDTIANQLKFVLHKLPLIVDISSFFLVGVGCLFVLSAFILALLYATGQIKDNSSETSSERTSLVTD